MQKITPFLWFDEGCEEGVQFYISVFNSAPGKRTESKIIRMDKYPTDIPNPPWPKGMDGKVINAIFELDGERFSALDGGKGIFPQSGRVSLVVECSSQAEVDHFWNKLTEGGDPKAQQCGWLSDKYGFAWQIVPTRLGELMSDPDREKVKRVTEAMLAMKKLDIAGLEAAYNGN